MRGSPAAAIRLAATATALVTAAGVVTACGNADGATDKNGSTVDITLTSKGCKPDPTKVPAGPVTFDITNENASKVSEAELLDGKVIAGEKENLTPGLSGSFSLKLDAGSYTVYCPNAKTEKWDFQVTGGKAKSSFSKDVSTSLNQATAKYHDYVVGQVHAFNKATGAFTDAVRAGDIAKAKRLYAQARYHYETVEPVAESFGSLDPQIDARVNDVAAGDRWTGFHRLEKALWKDGSLKGMTPVANELDKDGARLTKLVADTTYQPAQLANGATELLNEVASSKITGEEDRYSHTDLSDFKANIVGGKKAFDLLEPALRKIDPALAKRVDKHYGTVLSALEQYEGNYAGSGFENYAAVGQSERKALTQKVNALAEPLSEVAAKVTG